MRPVYSASAWGTNTTLLGKDLGRPINKIKADEAKDFIANGGQIVEQISEMNGGIVIEVLANGTCYIAISLCGPNDIFLKAETYKRLRLKMDLQTPGRFSSKKQKDGTVVRTEMPPVPQILLWTGLYTGPDETVLTRFVIPTTDQFKAVLHLALEDIEMIDNTFRRKRSHYDVLAVRRSMLMFFAIKAKELGISIDPEFENKSNVSTHNEKKLGEEWTLEKGIEDYEVGLLQQKLFRENEEKEKDLLRQMLDDPIITGALTVSIDESIEPGGPGSGGIALPGE